MTKEIEADGPRRRILTTARHLFGAHGFHSTTIAVLASEAGVSVGQIYRKFPGKEDIIVAIVEEDTRDHLNALEETFSMVDRGELTVPGAIEQFARNAMTRANEALGFEILAESYRNPRVGETVHMLSSRYRDLVRRLALRANPELDELNLDACVEIMTACFFGLSLRTSSRPMADPARLSEATACLIIRGLEPAAARCD